MKCQDWANTGQDQTELSWIKIEQELVSPFTPLDVLSQGSAINGQDFHDSLVLRHSKAVWVEVHKMCGASHLRQPHNTAVQIRKKNSVLEGMACQRHTQDK